MTRGTTSAFSFLVLLGWCGISTAHAQLTGSYDGGASGRTITAPIAAAAVFEQNGKTVSGTIAVGGDQTTTGGAYLVNGKATKKLVKVKGFNGNGAKLIWSGKLGASGASGKAKLKGPGQRLTGTLALTLNAPTGDGSSCDAVYTANSEIFTEQLIDQALVPCASCHVPGAQAGATRFHVVSGDPLATARAVAEMVDPDAPSASRLIAKPMLASPHGGGQQVFDGSAEAQSLLAWAMLVAESGCRP
jgi:hypothetical protein